MFEEENVVGMEQVEETTTEANVDTTSTDVASDEATKNEETSQAESKETKTPKSFTQEQVNDMMRKRIERERNSTIKSINEKYGAKDESELDELFKKSLSYDVMKERYDNLVSAKAELEKELAFTRNNIEPSKEDDIMAHFKGKEMEFNEETLKAELETHPEWLRVVEKSNKPKTTIKAISPERQISNEKDEANEMAKLFGLEKFI